MRALIAKLLVLLIALSATGALEVQAADNTAGSANATEHAHTNIADGEAPHSDSDCSDHCARHQCHLSHCKYSPLAYTIEVLPPAGAALVFLPPNGRTLDDFPLSLMRPPSV